MEKIKQSGNGLQFDSECMTDTELNVPLVVFNAAFIYFNLSVHHKDFLS